MYLYVCVSMLEETIIMRCPLIFQSDCSRNFKCLEARPGCRLVIHLSWVYAYQVASAVAAAKVTEGRVSKEKLKVAIRLMLLSLLLLRWFLNANNNNRWVEEEMIKKTAYTEYRWSRYQQLKYFHLPLACFLQPNFHLRFWICSLSSAFVWLCFIQIPTTSATTTSRYWYSSTINKQSHIYASSINAFISLKNE